MALAHLAPLSIAALAISGFASTGCSLLGPIAIENGRASYNDAIVATNTQQVLAMMVHLRYGEPSGLLAVSNVTANLRVEAGIGSEFGIGPDSNFAGNLVPLSAGLTYEENPTISYTPVQGTTYLRQYLSPVPIELGALMFDTLGDSPNVVTLLVRSINGIRNPDFLTEALPETDPRFLRIVERLAALSRGDHVVWAQDPEKHSSFLLAMHGEGEEYARQVGELYGLLGFAVPRDLDTVLTLPVQFGMGRPEKPAIRLWTRSLAELFSIAAASAEVPEEHLQAGLAPPMPPLGAAGRTIRIRGSESRPKQALVAFKCHGWWYSIDGTDSESKLTFRILEALMSVRMAESVERAGSPVLTVPVSR